MNEKTTISRWQMATITAALLIGTSTIVVPTGPAQQDAWISVLLGGAFGIVAMLVWYYIGNLFPGEIPAQYFPKIAGKFLGTLFAIFYVWFCLHLAALVIRNVVEVYMQIVFVATPPSVIYALSITLSMAALFAGLEPFARTTEIVIPFVILSILVVSILAAATPNLVKLENLLPIMERGIKPILKGAFANFAFPFGEFIVLTSVLPYVKRQKESRAFIVYPFIIMAVMLTLIQIRNTTILGPAGVRSALFPTFLSVQMINVGQFIQRLDALTLFTWTFGAFKKGTICFFAVQKNLGQLLGMKNKRLLIIPICSIGAYLSFILYRTTIDMLDFADYVYPIYAFPFQVALPLVLLVFALVKKKMGRI